MKQMPLFNLNIIENEKTVVYVVLPRIKDITLETIVLTTEFLNKYSKIVFLSKQFDYTFYKLLFFYSKTFSKIQNIELAVNNNFKIRDIQSNSAIVLYLLDEEYLVESHKKAIFCSISENSDFVFNDLSLDSRYIIPEYLRSLLSFMGIPEKNNINHTEIEYDDILETSNIARNHKGEIYHTIFMDSVIGSFKISNHLKKFRLNEKLLIVTNNKINTNDPKIVFYRDFDFLDLFALNIFSKNIYENENYDYYNIITQLRIKSIYTSSQKMEYSVLLKDITSLNMNL